MTSETVFIVSVNTSAGTPLAIRILHNFSNKPKRKVDMDYELHWNKCAVLIGFYLSCLTLALVTPVTHIWGAIPWGNIPHRHGYDPGLNLQPGAFQSSALTVAPSECTTFLIGLNNSYGSFTHTHTHTHTLKTCICWLNEGSSNRLPTTLKDSFLTGHCLLLWSIWWYKCPNQL